MKLDAPQLDQINHAISNSGEVCQMTLSNKGGESIVFTLSFRQLSLFVETVRAVAHELRNRLLQNQEIAKAEMLSTISEAREATSVVYARDQNTGDPIVTFEGPELGILAVRLSSDLSKSLQLQMASSGGGSTH